MKKVNTNCHDMSSSDVIVWKPRPIPLPLPPNKKLIGFGSFENVNLKLAGGGGSGPLDPPASYTPDCRLQFMNNLWSHHSVGFYFVWKRWSSCMQAVIQYSHWLPFVVLSFRPPSHINQFPWPAKQFSRLYNSIASRNKEYHFFY